MCVSVFNSYIKHPPQWGTVDSESKAPSVENPEMFNSETCSLSTVFDLAVNIMLNVYRKSQAY